ncbi:response regulator [Streptomyces sp. PRKS01-65]|nr:response regulator transcription factor [Streptomyces harenosi]NEY34056.1 response regulator [Streptomyces harenosi]
MRRSTGAPRSSHSGPCTETVRVFLVDDHPLFRAGVRLELEKFPDIELVGEASTPEEAAHALRRRGWPGPDVILADLSASEIREDEFIRTATELSDGRCVRVLFVATAETDEAVIAAMSAGAHGFLEKNTPRDELVQAIRLVAGGGAAFSPMVAARMGTYFSAVRALPDTVVFPDLTAREREVLDLLARGHGNREIARRLVLAEKTVRNHVSHIFAKLQVRDRAEAVVRARNAGVGL